MLFAFKRLFVALCLLLPLLSFSQNKGLTNELVNRIDTFSSHTPAEKVFVHLDKPYYSTTDTIWMKSYIMNAGLNYSKQSGLLYIELINDTGKVVTRQSMPFKLGLSFGQMALDDNTVTEGSYTLRAYTNWMQNQGEESFFTRRIFIGNNGDPLWMVNTDSKIVQKDGQDNLQIALQFINADKFPVRLREMQLKVMDGNKVISRDKLQTDVDGKINVNFNLPGHPSKNITVIAQDMRQGDGNKKLIIPINITRPGNTDLQFMPEGGNLVVGLPCRIGFKAIGEDGTGTNISGNIVNSKGAIVTTFRSQHMGMGSFNLEPAAGESYTAQIKLPAGSVKSYPLPPVKLSGISMRISNPADRDSVYIVILATPDIANTTGYSLIGQSGGKVCYAANLSFVDGVVHGRVNKALFNTGIVRFTLFNADKLPVAERLVFVDHHDELNISISTDKAVYQPKDSIALHLLVTDKDKHPVTGSYSLAITDDSQVKADSTNVPDIQSYMLLSGDLKGNVEEPGYYFNSHNADRYADLDNLLLTQGWVGYDWKDVFNTQYHPVFKAEPEIAVQGYISRTGGKSVGGLPVMLLSTKKPMLMRDVVSDKSGRFIFRDLPVVDTASYMIQVKDKKGKMFEAEPHVDEFKPAGIAALSNAALKPWYVNTDSTLLNYMKQNKAYNKELDDIKYPAGMRHLKAVNITGKKVIKGSHNLNGAGNSDQVLDEEDMKKAGKMTLEDMLNKGFIKGFGLGWFPKGLPRLFGEKASGLTGLLEPYSGYHFTYQIYANKIRLVIDGVDVHTFFQPAVYNQPSTYEEYNFYKQYLKELTAEDIKGIEVLYNNRYNNKYSYAYLEPKELDHTGHEFDPWNVEYVYLEITTWSGNGAYMKRTHGRYLYRPIPITLPKQFYKPKYTAKTGNPLADMRPTVYWEPNVVTDSTGKATVWFYAKGKATNYTGILQGSDLSGSVGSGKVSIKVK